MVTVLTGLHTRGTDGAADAANVGKEAQMRIIPTRIHGMLDYLMGVILIAAPWLLDFAEGGPEQWVPVILGAGVILYSLLTKYELGVVAAISMPLHLGLDVAGGIFLAASPWIFGFSDVIWWPHVVFGLFEVGAGLMTQTTPEYEEGQPPAAGVHA
jgi:hypothetical protein